MIKNPIQNNQFSFFISDLHLKGMLLVSSKLENFMQEMQETLGGCVKL